MSTPLGEEVTAYRTSDAPGIGPDAEADDGRSGTGKKVLVYALLVVFAVLYVYPFVVQVATSFKTNSYAVSNPLTLFPSPVTVAAFERVFQSDFPLWFMNSVMVAVLVTLGRVFFCSLAGYSLARLKYRGRDALFTTVLAVMAVPGVVLLIPKFLVLNYMSIYDTRSALFVPLLVDAAGVFIMKQFFETIPVSVEEAARIDGASTFRTFWSIVLPMGKPALITLTILSFQASWNELGHMIIAVQDPDLYTLTRGVAQLTSGGLGSGQQFPISMAAALLMTIPTAVVFIVFQRFFTQGANAGAEKG
jgi:multiple sugar transport system permease protein